MINKKSSDTTMRVSAHLFMYRSAERRSGAFRIWIGSAPIRTLDMAYPTYGYGIRSEDRSENASILWIWLYVF